MLIGSSGIFIGGKSVLEKARVSMSSVDSGHVIGVGDGISKQISE